MLESWDHRTLISTRSERGPSTTLTVHVIRAMFGCDFVPPNLHLCRFGRRRWHGWAQAIAMLVTWVGASHRNAGDMGMRSRTAAE